MWRRVGKRLLFTMGRPQSKDSSLEIGGSGKKCERFTGFEVPVFQLLDFRNREPGELIF